MSGSWNDFNDAQQVTNLIPKGTIAKVQLFFRPGGFDDPAQGWTGGYATRGASGAVYLDSEFIVLEGVFARRKSFTAVGLYSPKGPEWGNMGRGLIRGILNSARGISNKDASPQAQAARRINGFADLGGIAFLAKIDIGKDANDGKKTKSGSRSLPITRITRPWWALSPRRRRSARSRRLSHPRHVLLPSTRLAFLPPWFMARWAMRPEKHFWPPMIPARSG